ncbi:ATP-dependent transcriptional regulator [Longilinea arvoryzae]|uniref:ATP-dependent transcriptional regulator n=1 Tax=Longilinea arvoryzae TaxID=360412 RepID=A0A0K8MZQ5_9CHLR|nr:response regulator transcription factor [Longilinea arvoryzae]GAP16142.1 ATP-dependent transcriptional regulator [Longilinea arvoryzae]
MNKTHLPIRIASLALMIVGAGLLALSILSDGRYNIALPLVFLVLGGAFFIVVFSLREKVAWAVFLYIPAALLIAFGVIFLLNVITGDWNAWAYAWLFLVTGIGVGLLLAARERPMHPAFNSVGWGLTLGGITFFAVFGAITGGLVIQIMAPILLVTAGLSLRWLHIETLLPEDLRRKLGFAARGVDGSSYPPEEVETLVEPLSSRELEVLRLIDLGMSNQQIAEKLTVAPSTVKTHINNLYGKLGVQTRVQAVNRAHALHLLGD